MTEAPVNDVGFLPLLLRRSVSVPSRKRSWVFAPTVVSHGKFAGEPIVSEVLRSGYTWKGRVLRAAMVKTKD